MDRSAEFQDFKGTGYELFIMTITVLAIANLFIIWFTPNTDMDQVIIIINFVLSLLLMVDFFYRLLTSPNKRKYLVRDFGWLDFLGSLPIFGMQLLRLFRFIRILRLFKELGTRRLAKDLRRERAASAMATVLFLVILVLQFGSYLMVGAEELSTTANITTPLDAIWWAFVTITTVGFGDKYPVTNIGRVIGTFVIITGVVLFTVLTGFIATRFFSINDLKVEEDLSPVKSDLESIHSLLEQQGQSLHKLEDQITQLQNQIKNKI